MHVLCFSAQKLHICVHTFSLPGTKLLSKILSVYDETVLGYVSSAQIESRKWKFCEVAELRKCSRRKLTSLWLRKRKLVKLWDWVFCKSVPDNPRRYSASPPGTAKWWVVQIIKNQNSSICTTLRVLYACTLFSSRKAVHVTMLSRVQYLVSRPNLAISSSLHLFARDLR